MKGNKDRLLKSSFVGMGLCTVVGLVAGYVLRGGGSERSLDQETGASRHALSDSPTGKSELAGGSKANGAENSSPVAGGDSIPDQLERFRDVLTSGSSIASKASYFNLLMEMNPEAAPGLLQLFVDLEGTDVELGEERHMFWQRWGEIDGENATAAIFERNQRFTETKFATATIAAWAKEDPQAARDWLLAQRDVPLRNGMIKGLLSGMARGDVVAAERFINKGNLDHSQKAHGYWRIARHHLQDGGKDAVSEWYDRFADNDPMLSSITHTTADIFTDGPVSESIDWLQSLEGTPERVAALQKIATRRLVQKKPDNVVIYFGDHAEALSTPGVSELAAAATNAWIRSNPNAMGEWLGGKMDSPNYDLLAAPFVRNIATRDPGSAAEWAATIHDAGLRAQVQAELGISTAVGTTTREAAPPAP